MENTKNKRILIYFLAFLIPVVLLVIDYYFVGIFPFGDKTILYRDLNGQYVSYFSDLRNALVGHGGIFYSFTKGLGGNMIGIITYYLMSPLNLIIVLFPANMITEAILTITILKVALCGLTFMFFIEYTFKNINYKSLMFTTAYAMMGFNIVYQSNIMWLDAVYLMPLVLMGINKIVNGEKKKTYVIALAATIITSFYTGFMVCIFATLYFIYLIANKIYYKEINIKGVGGRIVTFVICSGIAGIASLVSILPTLYALQGGKSTFAFFTANWKPKFHLIDLASKVYLNRGNDNTILHGLPSIYTGILMIILVLLFFLNRGIKLYDKIAAAAMFLILIASLDFPKINYFWHGFNRPSGFPYRFVFVVSFFIVLIAYKSFLKVKENHLMNLWIIVIVMAIPLIHFWNTVLYSFPKPLVMASFVLVLVYCIGLAIYIKGKIEQVVIGIIGIVFIAELGINGYNTFGNLPYGSKVKMNYYLNTVGKTMAHIQDSDKSFYRLEKTFDYNRNDPMLINYRGLSQFSSVYKVSLRKMVDGLGFLDNGISSIYDTGSTVTANSLINMKYVVSQDKMDKAGFKFLYKYDGLYVYENMYYLNLGFMVNKDFAKQEIIGTKNPFHTQNEILHSMVKDSPKSVYDRINDYKVIPENAKVVRDGNYIKAFQKDINKPASITIEFRAPNNNPIYAFPQSNSIGLGQIYLNGELLSGYSMYNYKTMGLGTYKPGTLIKLKIELGTTEFIISDNEIYSLNMKNYKEIYNELTKQQLDVTSYTNREINGTVDVKENNEILYTTIPYDLGWKVYVNGKEAPYEEVMGSLIGVPLNKGVNTLEFKFTPRGLYLGFAVSLATLAGCVIYTVIEDKQRKKAKKKSE